jgi:hypothetical protein
MFRSRRELEALVHPPELLMKLQGTHEQSFETAMPLLHWRARNSPAAELATSGCSPRRRGTWHAYSDAQRVLSGCEPLRAVWISSLAHACTLQDTDETNVARYSVPTAFP